MDSLTEAGEVLTGFIIFNIAEEEFAIDIKIVQAILKMENFNNSSLVRTTNISTIEYENETFHLFNLHTILKYNIPNNIVSPRIILLNFKNHKAAILADKIKEFLAVNHKTWKLLQVIPISDKKYISGKISFEDRNIFVLDLDNILKDEFIFQHLETQQEAE